MAGVQSSFSEYPLIAAELIAGSVIVDAAIVVDVTVPPLIAEPLIVALETVGPVIDGDVRVPPVIAGDKIVPPVIDGVIISGDSPNTVDPVPVGLVIMLLNSSEVVGPATLLIGGF